MSLETPLLLMVFNRPDTTAKVFEAIRQAQPKQLFVAADGPREGKEGEAAKCQEVRQIATAIDWDCELHTLFRDTNAGCGYGPAENITWFFRHVEQGIILEDDCIAGPSFFSYCTELLHKYKDDERIMHISGNNFAGKEKNSGDSYHFYKYLTAWGWATWRRAWDKYDFQVPFLQDFLTSDKFDALCLNNKQRKYWTMIADMIIKGEFTHAWDYQWLFTCWQNDGLGIVPAVNLVTNIGFNADATHTVNESRVSYVKSEALPQLVHPRSIKRNTQIDNKTFTNYFDVPQHLNKLRGIMYKLFPDSIMQQVKKIRRRFFPNMK